jgi:SAM-dependent methyltransferase
MPNEGIKSHVNKLANRFRLFAKSSSDSASPLSTPNPNMFNYEGFDIPVDLMLLTGGGPETFDAISKEHMTELETLIGVKPNDSVVEIGCGIGRDAIPLLKRLSNSGKYLGVDIDKSSIDWCTQNISMKFPHFTFLYLDIKNDRYNPKGLMSMSEVHLPRESQTIDIIIAQSVFTHLLRPDALHYMKEFARMLKPSGLVLATFFITDDEILASARASNLTQWRLTFEHEIETGCRINNLLQPNEAVAYTMEVANEIVHEAGLRLAKPLVNGRWSGHFPKAAFGQDIAILGTV